MNEPTSERVPPYSEEAEKGVLGCIFFEPEESLDICIEMGVTADDFYIPAHTMLINQISEMLGNQERVDQLTIAAKLKHNGKLDQVGGERYMHDIMDCYTTMAHLEHYVELIKQASKRRNLIQICREGERESRIVDDPEALRAELETKLSGMENTAKLKTMKSAFQNVMVRMDDGMKGKPVEIGISTGIPALDELNSGGMRTGVYWLSGKEGTGKSFLKDNIIENFLSRGDGVGLCTLEMSMEDEAERLIGLTMDANVGDVIKGKSVVSAEKIKKAYNLYVESGLFHMADQTTVRTTVEFMSWARRLKVKHNVKLIVLDYFQRIQIPGNQNMGIEEATTKKSDAVTTTANMLDLPILSVAAINDQGKIRGSRMADYDGAGHWRLEALDESGSEAKAPYFDRPIDLVTGKARFGVPFKRLHMNLRGLTGEFTVKGGGGEYDRNEPARDEDTEFDM